jgi:cytoskeletal protein CcmA (bactofilin family)
MFQRNPTNSSRPTDVKPLIDARLSSAPPPMPAAASTATTTTMSASLGSELSPRSVIGNDLTISGHDLSIVSRGALQIDGQIQGDVRGAEVIIGEKGKVEGTVSGEQVIVRGTALGVVRGVRVSLLSGSRVEGDVHHASLSIEQGAMFEGRARRHAESTVLEVGGDTDRPSTGLGSDAAAT